jgi:hypothetical protein
MYSNFLDDSAAEMPAQKNIKVGEVHLVDMQGSQWSIKHIESASKNGRFTHTVIFECIGDYV